MARARFILQILFFSLRFVVYSPGPGVTAYSAAICCPANLLYHPRAVLQQRITTEFVFFSISRDADPLQETSSLQKRCNQVHDGHPTRQREMEFHRAVRQLSTHFS